MHTQLPTAATQPLSPTRGPSASTPPSLGKNWRPVRLSALAGPVCQAADLTLLSAAFLGIVIFPHFQLHHQTLRSVLDLRVSLRNLLVAVLCLTTWRTILWSIGLYSPNRSRSLADYVFRSLIALNSCTAVVGLITLILHARIDLWRAIAIFWAASLLAASLLRGVLLLVQPVLRSGVRPQGSKLEKTRNSP